MNFGGSGIMEELFRYIRETLPDGRTILELGSGDVSTQYLAQHYNMISIEDKPEWLYRHKSRYIHAPLIDGWYDRDEVQNGLLHDRYDLILVDGPTGEGNRSGFLSALDLFQQDVPIIFDDTNRLPEWVLSNRVSKKLKRQAKSYETFTVVTL
jgi:hypothetical protein